MSKEQASKIPGKPEFAEKSKQYKVRISGLAEMDLMFFIDRQLHDMEKV